MYNFFWQSYLQIEKEVLDLTSYILINDSQFDVYSIKIADLIIRVNVEIESIAKEIYKNNNGPKPKNGQHLIYDSECLKFLDTIWTLSKKQVIIINPWFQLEKEENKIFPPLKNAYKTGEPKWKEAYQSLKHDRANSLQKGSLRFLIKSMGALFLLNVYNQGVSQKFENITKIKEFDTSLGSSIFSVKLFQESRMDFRDLENPNLNIMESVLISFPERERYVALESRITNLIKQFDEKRWEYTIKNLDLYKLNVAIKDVENKQEGIKLFFKQKMSESLSELMPSHGREIASIILSIPYIVELNKNQFIKVSSVKNEIDNKNHSCN